MSIGNLAPLRFISDEFRRLGIDAYHNKDKINMNIIDQRKLQEEILETYDPCDDIKDDMSSSMSKFRSTKFEHLLAYDFYNANVMKAAQCINRAYFSSEAYPYEEKIRKWFTSMKQIGSPSAYGTAMQADIADRQAIYIIKAPKDIQVDLLHEYIIGIYGLNKLRYYVPNFAYILGAFKCNAPYIQKDKRISAVCLPDSKNKVTYVVYERIYPGVELSKYILFCSEEDFLSIWLQLCYSLDLAQRDMRYNHNDLHTENVIVRSMPQEVSIHYRYRDTDIYVRTRSIATLIDYGLSRLDLNYKGRKYIITDASMYSYKPFSFCSLRDIFKLLSFCVYTLVGKNAPASGIIVKLYKFFYDGSNLVHYITSMRKNYFSYYRWEGNVSVNLDIYIDWIHQNFDVNRIVSWKYRDARIRLLACDHKCISKRGIISLLDAFGESSRPKDLIDLYDHVFRLKSRSGSRSYPIEAYLASNLNLFLSEVNKAIDMLNNVLAYSRSSIFMRWNLSKQETYTHDINFMFDKDFISKYREYVDIFMNMIDEFTTAKSYLDIIIMLLPYISSDIKKDVDRSILLKDATDRVNELIRRIRLDIGFVLSVPNNRFTSKESQWWIQSFTQLSSILP